MQRRRSHRLEQAFVLTPSRARQARVERMVKALAMIGWSGHTGRPRFGPKAQVARWGLGEDELPADETARHRVA